jgi:hypothetical protein
MGAAGQLALASLLRPQDFGLVGPAFTVSSFVELAQQEGIRTLLVRRARRFAHSCPVEKFLKRMAKVSTRRMPVAMDPVSFDTR